MAEAIIFNALGSTAEVTHSITGPNLQEVGTPVYVTGQFGNGVSCTGTDKVDGIINSVLPNNEAGTMEVFWKKIDTGSAFIATIGNLVSGDYMVRFTYTTNIIACQITFQGSAPLMNTSIDSSGLTNGVWQHLRVVWDRSGINGGSDTARWHLNGVQQDSITTAISALTFPVNYRVTVANAPDGTQPIGASSGTDNLKIYNFGKTDFSGRFNERDGLNDVAVII